MSNEITRIQRQFHTHSLTCTMSMTLTTHTHREQRLLEQTHIIVEASCLSTLTLRLFESPLNNLDPLGSGKTHESRSYDVIWIKGQDCDAYTARLPVAFEQTPALFVLTYWSSYRTVEKQRSWSQKHRMDHFLLWTVKWSFKMLQSFSKKRKCLNVQRLCDNKTLCFQYLCHHVFFIAFEIKYIWAIYFDIFFR